MPSMDSATLTPVPMTLDVPARDCPLRFGVHPEVARLERSIRDWESRFELLRTERDWAVFDMLRSGWLTAACYPRLPYDVLEPAGHLCSWILQFDECGLERPANRGDFAQAAANLARIRRIVENPESALPAAEPCWLALQDVLRRIYAIASTEQRYRFEIGLLQWLHGNACELAYRADPVLPTLADFLTVRKDTSGSTLFAALITFGHGRMLGEAAWASAALRELRALGDLLYGVDNDIAGYLRDAQSSRQLRWNIVDVIAHEQRIPAAEAMRRACALHREAMQRAADLCAELQRRPDPAVREFSIDFEHLMSGPWRWYQAFDRYRVVDEF